MSLEITLRAWHVLALLTALGWAALIAWPRPFSHSDFGIGAAVDDMVRLAGGLIVTLTAWLVYFAIT